MSKVAVAKTGIFSTLSDLDSKTEDSDTKPEIPEPDKTVAFTVSLPISAKEKLEHICLLLDEVRLNFTESAGQGFLFNAHHQIQTFLNGLK